ncbi:putative sulfate exporter family transporter [Salinibacterium sp. ZJ77]|uniref:YeiH family protein n=1 Tax=Salinibacterium sp. ZJ77 TaxID=2708337 RepID=UPI001FBB6ADA|nr:putative sulfate exporter family transporter [Salinibacterium sp. ZJ77]
MTRVRSLLPGVLAMLGAAALAWALSLAIPAVPWLSIAFVLGVALGSIPVVRQMLDGALRAGTAFSARTLLRVGIVLLGFNLVLADVAALGAVGVAAIVVLVVLAFAVTYGIARAFRLPGDEPMLLAAGFSICGVSAIGAMAAARRRAGAADDSATPVALVTLFGTAAIVVLPTAASASAALGAPLPPELFGAWVGASVHDVGQVVATAQTAGTVALAMAVVVKLTRVLMLAPMVAVASLAERRRTRRSGEARGDLPPVVPLFIVGFAVLVLVRSVVPVPEGVVEAVDLVRTVLLATALAAIGANLRLERLVRTGGRAVAAASLSWLVILLLALGAGVLATA